MFSYDNSSIPIKPTPVRGSSPSYLSNLLPTLQNSRNPNRQNKFYSFQKNTNFFANSFYPYSTDQWNDLDPALKNIQSISSFKKALLAFIRPTAAQVFNVSDHYGLKLLTRLRLHLSHLNEHKFQHNFRDTINPLCSCSLEPETTTHFLLHCPHHNEHRQTLLDNLYNIDNSIINLSDDDMVLLLLYGNIKLYTNEQNNPKIS